MPMPVKVHFVKVCLFLAMILAAPLHAGFDPGPYVTGALGGQVLNNEDINKYLDNTAFGAGKPAFSSTLGFTGSLGLGWQFASRLGLEAGLDLGPSRAFTYLSKYGNTPTSYSRRVEGSQS